MLSGRADTTFPPLRYEDTSRLAAANRALARVPVAVWLVGLVAVSALFRFWIARSSPTPWIMPDEFRYMELSRSVADLGHFSVNGAGMPTLTYGPLYPLLIAPAWIVTASATHAYAAIQFINCVVMSTAAVFAYLLGRRVLTKQLSFFLALLTVLVPSMVYSSKAMTESLAYPVFLVAVLSVTRALEKPSSLRQVVALITIAMATLARAEMIVLLPALITAIIAFAAMPARDRHVWKARMNEFRLTFVIVGIAVASAMIAIALKGHGFTATHDRWMHGLRWSHLPRWLLTYVGELDLYVGIIPFAAFVIMVALAFRSHAVTPAARPVLAISGSSFLWFVSFIAVYTTRPRINPAIHDRYLFYLVPLELLALLLWISLGAPRPKAVALPAAAVALIAPALIPFSEFLTGRAWGVSSANVALVPWGLLKPIVGTGWLLVAIVFSISAIGVAVFWTASIERAATVRIVLVLNFLFITFFVIAGNTTVAKKASETWIAPDAHWVDTLVPADSRVIGLWQAPQGSAQSSSVQIADRWNALLETKIFNDQVTALYAVGGVDLLSKRDPFAREATSESGALREGGEPLVADYVLASPEIPVAGQVVARDPHTGLVLLRSSGAEVRILPQR